MSRVTEIEAKSIFSPSKLPDADYVANPYIGCAFGCAYCYASFMGRYVGEPIEAWGDYIYVKRNAVELAKAELGRMSEGRRQATILLSSVTDPYQGVEAKYRLTRGILRELEYAEYPGLISILTKSPLVRRDLDVLQSLARVEVGFTITTTDDTVSKWLEMRAPIASRRLDALGTVAAAGLHTYVFVGPLLPHFADRPELLDRLLEAIAATGTNEVFVEHMNMSSYIRSRLDQVLNVRGVDDRVAFAKETAAETAERLEAIVADLLTKHRLTLRLGRVLRHGDE